MRLVIVSGLSGSGKSVALRELEDIDFYCVDNIPAALLKPFIAHTIRGTDEVYRRTAVGLDARCSEAIRKRGAREPGELTERRDPETLERADQRCSPIARAQEADRELREVLARAAGDDQRAARSRGAGGGECAEARRGGSEAARSGERAPSGAKNQCVAAAMDPAQAVAHKVGLARVLRFDGGADLLERAQRLLPGCCDSQRVGADELELGAARERFAERHSLAHTECLGCTGCLAERPGAALRGDRQRPAGESRCPAERYGQLETENQEAPDHTNTCSHAHGRDASEHSAL